VRTYFLEPSELISGLPAPCCARRHPEEASNGPSLDQQGGQWPQLLRSTRRESAMLVEDRDRDLERHHPVVPPADQQDARPDAGEVRRAHTGLCRDAHFHLGDAVDQV
jgi:hypothetical protein